EAGQRRAGRAERLPRLLQRHLRRGQGDGDAQRDGDPRPGGAEGVGVAPLAASHLRSRERPGEENTPDMTDAAPQGQVVADTLAGPTKPWFNRAVVWANLLVFGGGLAVAAWRNIAFEFLVPIRVERQGLVFVQNPALFEIFDLSGQLTRA